MPSSTAIRTNVGEVIFALGLPFTVIGIILTAVGYTVTEGKQHIWYFEIVPDRPPSVLQSNQSVETLSFHPNHLDVACSTLASILQQNEQRQQSPTSAVTRNK
jgi:hypothetical protein